MMDITTYTQTQKFISKIHCEKITYRTEQSVNHPPSPHPNTHTHTAHVPTAHTHTHCTCTYCTHTYCTCTYCTHTHTHTAHIPTAHTHTHHPCKCAPLTGHLVVHPITGQYLCQLVVSSSAFQSKDHDHRLVVFSVAAEGPQTEARVCGTASRNRSRQH